MVKPSLDEILESELYIPCELEYVEAEERADRQGLKYYIFVLTVREINDRYRRRVFLNPGPYFVHAQELLSFLGLPNSAETTVEDVRIGLESKQFLEIDVKKFLSNAAQYGWANDLGSSIIHDGVSYVDFHDSLPQGWYEPVNSFSGFIEEKEFAGQYGLLDTWPWKRPPNLDGDIADIVNAFNRIPFVYSSGSSHSGTPDDRRKNSLLAESWRTCSPDRIRTQLVRVLKTGLDVSYRGEIPEYSGYINFRADETNESYLQFESELNGIHGVVVRNAHVLVDSIGRRYYTQELTVTGNKNLIEKESVTEEDIQAYQKDMMAKWQKVRGVLDKYAA